MGSAAGIAAAVGAAATVGSTIYSATSGGGDNTSSTQSGPPAWVQQDYQNAISGAQGVAGAPLNQYQGPMVAGFTPYQIQAMQGVEGAQGVANPYINTAAQYASSAAAPIGVPGQISGGQLGGLYSAGLGYSNQAAGTNIAGAGYPGISSAMSGANYGESAAGQGASSIGRAVGMGSPQNYGGNISTYMSPYTQDVVNSTQAEFNNQNAQQQQGVEGNAISSGAWGGDRASVAQGITAGQQSLAQAPVIAGLENQGYQNAQSELNQQQSLGIQGGQAAGQLGLSAGQLASTTGLQAGQLGQSAAAQQAALQQQSAQAQLGLFSGQQQTGIGAQEASGWLGANAANIYGALGQQAQGSALTDASALYSMGTQQQNLEQEQLNVPYEQFEAQQAYPFQTQGWLDNVEEGIGNSSGGTSSTTTPGPSLVSQGIGGALAGAGLYNAVNGGSSGGLSSYTPFYADSSTGASAQSTIDASALDSSVPFYGNRGGRIHRAFGGSMPGTSGNGPYGFTPNRGPTSFGRGGIMPRGFAAGGVPIVDTGPEDASVSIIPMATSPTQHSKYGQIPSPPPVTPQTDTLSSMLTPQNLSGLSSIGGGMAAGGTVPPSGAYNARSAKGLTPGVTPNSSPVVGETSGSRGIDHPVLAGPTPDRLSSAGIPVNLQSNYSPPPVSSLPYTSTTFPSLSGGTGGPTTVSVNPVKSASGTWAPPASATPAAPANYTGTPTTLSQVYSELLHRGVDPSGQAYYANEPLSQVEASIRQSPEYTNDQSTDYGAHARGGPAGFRPRKDGGGGIINQSGAVSAGQPVGGGNPLAQGMYQNFAQLPPEKLQELAVRLPPNSSQGQLVRRALQMSHANPQTTQPQSASQPQQAATPTPSQQPMMARGGRTGFADGGGAIDFGGSNPFGGLGTMPSDLSGNGPAPGNSSGLDVTPETKSIFDLIGGQAVGAAKGFSSPVPAQHAGQGAAGFTPRSAPTIPDAPVGPTDVKAPDDIVSNAVTGTTALKGSNIDTTPSPQSEWMKSPWMAVAAAGAGMLASRDPHPGVAIGEGLETGLKFAGSQQTEADKQQAEADRQTQMDNENLWKNKDIDLRVKEMNQALDIHKDNFTLDTKKAADDEQRNQDEAAFHRGSLGIEQEGATAHQTEANRGYWEPARAMVDAGGKPVVDANGVPQAIWIDRYTGAQKQGPAQDPTMMGGKSGTNVSAWKRDAWLAVHPGDDQGALDFVAGHKNLEPAQAMNYGYAQARSEANATPGTMDAAAIDARAKEVAGQIIAGPQTAAAPAGKGAPAAAAPAATGIKPTAPVSQNGNLYDPTTHAYLGPAP